MPLALWALACGGGPEPVGSLFDGTQRRTEFVVEAAPEGMPAPVTVDSSAWSPTAALPAPGQTLEILGQFSIIFRNRTDAALRLRYDLRFIDEQGFLVDNYIPPGQPVELAPGATVAQGGEFVLRAGADAARFGLRTMRIAARVERAGQGA